jgi:dienelactone hydrolase
MSRSMQRLHALLLAGSLMLAGAALANTPPAPPPAPAADGSGRAGFQTLDFDWFDALRERRVPVRLYLPDGARPEAPVPLVVFSHGIGGSRQGYSWLGRHWASRGYASLHLQHVGSDRGLWAGNPFELVARLQGAATDGEALSRVRDLSFALDRLLGSAQGARIDAQRIAAAGHSYGANTALLAAGATVQRDGRVLPLRDARIQAVLLLSAPPFYGEAAPEQVLGPVRVPSLHVTATEDVIRIPGFYSGAQDRVAVFDATGSSRKTLAVFAGGSHSIFTDRTGTGGPQLNQQVKEATRVLSLAFLDSVFKSDERGLADWPGQFSSIVARYSRSTP